MQTETLVGLIGLAGTAVGATLSTGVVVWQQRKAAHDAERVHLLTLAEAAANEVIRLSYEMEDLFEQRDPAEEGWRAELRQKCRGIDEQSLRIADKDVRTFMGRIHAELFVVSTMTGRFSDPGHYSALCVDIRQAMGFVLRREPLPEWFLLARAARRREV
ncbi:hypothetical protein JK361_10035 [Streptomyces sp. 5-8]|uniref:Uncharacterized protein n=1 Tax=Streptomyces musisoli TaxID=2802280 RepID=A0ABS1NXU4_9ACTN|nr:hypothetical protein [Streptomyces musisoli]MBL1104929.1 hypothetical protein [Streptomyces musisoli]